MLPVVLLGTHRTVSARGLLMTGLSRFLRRLRRDRIVLVSKMSSDERRRLLIQFMDEVALPHRRRLIEWRGVSNQTAQLDSDGYVGEIIASMVTGVCGNSRRGKSGDHPGDLSDGSEVKSTMRVEQKGGKEDAHFNFGSKTRAQMDEFMQHSRWIVVSYTYDQLDRLQVDVLTIDPTNPATVQAVNDFYLRSIAAKPQLQSRLYPDNRRGVLAAGPTSLTALGARLLAKGVETANGFQLAVWTPDAPTTIDYCLGACQDSSKAVTPAPRQTGTADEFFHECMVPWRHGILPYCDSCGTTRNIGFGNLSQHLVSIVSGIPGTDSNARGADLYDGSEIKLAMGVRGDVLGTEDFPRLNLGCNTAKILGWPTLYAVRLMCEESHGLMVRVGEPDMTEFRQQVSAYFGPGSRHCGSTNLQYHAPRAFDDEVYTGDSGNGVARTLRFRTLFKAIESDLS